MKKLSLLIIISLAFISCHKKNRQYTMASVSEEISNQYNKARNFRREGKLHKSAVVAEQLGTKIAKEYPKSMVYRENVIKIMNFIYRIARLSRDKALEIKTESVNPSDAKIYSQHADNLENLVRTLRKQLPSYPLLHKKVKKVSIAPKEEAPNATSDSTSVKTTGDSTSTNSNNHK